MADLNASPLAYDNSSPAGVRSYQESNIYVVNAEDLIMRPDVRKTIFPHWPFEANLMEFFVQAGKTYKTEQSEFHHYEEKPLIPLAQIRSKSGSAGAGNAVTITIEAVNSDKLVPFKGWDTVDVGGIQGWIQSNGVTVDATDGRHQFVIKPVDSDDDIVTAAVAGDFVVWTGTAKADGVGQPEGMLSTPVQFSGQTQIIPTTYVTDGSAAANMSDVVTTKSGSRYAYYRGVEQAYDRHMIAIAMTLFLGKKNNGLVDAVNDNRPVRLTEGMDQKIANYGIDELGNAFDYDEIAKVNQILDVQGAPEYYMVPSGNKFYDRVTKAFFGAGTNGLSEPAYGAFSGSDWTKWGSADPKQRAIDIGVDVIKFGHREFAFKKERFLYYKNITGAPGQPYPDRAYFLPMAKFRDAGEGVTTAIKDTCAIRYKASDRENRYMQSTVKDWKTDGIDKFYFWHRSELGWMQAMLHWAVRWSYDENASS